MLSKELESMGFNEHELGLIRAALRSYHRRMFIAMRAGLIRSLRANAEEPGHAADEPATGERSARETFAELGPDLLPDDVLSLVGAPPLSPALTCPGLPPRELSAEDVVKGWLALENSLDGRRVALEDSSKRYSVSRRRAL
jgi:hypothetical protein